MKKAQAFYETVYEEGKGTKIYAENFKGGKTALVVGVEDPGCFFCIKITHLYGAESSHPVSLKLTLGEAMEEAKKFLGKIKCTNSSRTGI